MSVKPFVTLEEIENAFQDLNLSPEKTNLDYIQFHRYRYQYLLGLIDNHLKKINTTDTPIKLLDIGPAYQTFLFRKFFPQLKVDSLGYNNPYNQLRANEQHFKQNLNECDTSWHDEIKNYHIINFCEVIEHLYTRPEIVLKRLHQSLQKDGIVIIQTPNAVGIHKRARMLVGQNPYQLMTDNKMGHFREYTSKELSQMATSTGFEVVYLSFKNYLNANQSFLHNLFIKAEPIFPNQLRDGITIVFQKK